MHARHKTALWMSVVLATVLAGGSALSSAATRSHASSPSTNATIFADATARWESEYWMFSSAIQAIPLWRIEDDLRRERLTGATQKSMRHHTLAVLVNLARMPDAMANAAQDRQIQRDWTWLNRYFAISGREQHVLSFDVPSGASFHSARREFNLEPSGRSSGVSVSALEQAAQDLQREATLVPSRAVVYAAAIYDVNNLATASARDIAAMGSSQVNAYGEDVLYLNYFFGTARFEGPPNAP